MGPCGAGDFDEVGLDEGVDVGGGPESEIEGPLVSLFLRRPLVVLQWLRLAESSLCVY